MLAGAVCAVFTCISVSAGAQIAVPVPEPITEIIKAAIVKVIKAVDLQVQRWQNETIWLQNAQKVIENELTKLKLEEIAGWVERQRDLYADYFDELQQVKDVIAYYHRVRELVDLQRKIVNEYQVALGLFRGDPWFTTDEYTRMQRVYTGIFETSVGQVEELYLVVRSLTVSMSDAARLKEIEKVAAALQQCYDDLQQFNEHNKMISLHRAAEARAAARMKSIYGLP
jgi:hypothetical protein